MRSGQTRAGSDLPASYPAANAMADIKERQTILPVLPANPGRGPGQRRQRPRSKDEDGAAAQRKREPGSGRGHAVDEYA